MWNSHKIKACNHHTLIYESLSSKVCDGFIMELWY